MSCDDDTAELLRREGHKPTPQRLMVVRALRHADGHRTATSIVDEVRAAFPFVDVSTVYRTLDVLKRLRLVTATDMGSGDAVFEWAPGQPHHHLICSGCNRVTEIPHRYLQQLEGALSADFRFEPNLDHFAIFGLCGECRAQTAVAAATAPSS